MFGSLVPSPIPQRTSGVSVSVDTAPQYPAVSYEPDVLYPMMEPSSGVSVTGDIYLILGKCKLFGEYILLGAVLHFLKILSVNGMKC